MNAAQRKATEALRLAMVQADKTGLALGVFGGTVLACPKGPPWATVPPYPVYTNGMTDYGHTTCSSY